jgi:hypothetical protein
MEGFVVGMILGAWVGWGICAFVVTTVLKGGD